MSTSITPQFEKVRLVYDNKIPAHQRLDMSTSDQAYQILMQDWDHGQLDLIEETKLLLLDRSSRLMSICPLSKGGMDGDNIVIDPKIVFTAALIRKAHQIIIVQNYPGGEFRPSFIDHGMVKQLSEGGFILDIPMIDYMVVTPQGYYSFIRDEERGFVQAPTNTL